MSTKEADSGEDSSSFDDGKPLSAGKLTQVSPKLLSREHFYIEYAWSRAFYRVSIG